MNILLAMSIHLLVIGVFAWLMTGGHRWKYRNPYDRTCTRCGRNEVSHCRDLESWRNSWWEVFNEGSGHFCKKRKDDSR